MDSTWKWAAGALGLGVVGYLVLRPGASADAPKLVLRTEWNASHRSPLLTEVSAAELAAASAHIPRLPTQGELAATIVRGGVVSVRPVGIESYDASTGIGQIYDRTDLAAPQSWSNVRVADFVGAVSFLIH
jgi:hypothetical protein